MSCETQLRLCGDGIGSLSHFTFLGIFVEFVSLGGLRIRRRIWIGERARTMTKTGLVGFFSLAFSLPAIFTFPGATKSKISEFLFTKRFLSVEPQKSRPRWHGI